MKISPKITAIALSVLGVAGGVAGTIALQTHAAGTTTTSATAPTSGSFRHGTPPAAAGTVTAVGSGTITVTDKRTNTSYTVNTSGATVEKFTPPTAGTTPATRPTPTTISASDIAVGDNVMVQGTVSGTTITATKITDGMMMGFRGHGFMGMGTMGTVSAISGNTITLTGKNGTTYTVDASSAKVNKVTSSNVAGISVGDTLMVNGTVSGNSITAKGITDGQMGFGK